MKVILTQDVRGKGKRGQMIEVSDGYARNFLLPKKLAQEANADNINTMRMNDKATQERQAKERAEALEISKKMKDMTVVVMAKGGGAGKLFGSVTNAEIAEALEKQEKITLDKRKIVVEPIKTTGVYTAKCKLGYEITADLKVEVKEVASAKVTGLPDALAGKVDKVAGKGLSANDYTDEEKEKLGGVEAGANKNLIEIIKLAGAALNISEKAVNIPFAGDTAGVVTSSTGENKVAVAEDGSMEVNSLNMNKLVQSDGDTLILDGGNAAV